MLHPHDKSSLGSLVKSQPGSQTSLVVPATVSLSGVCQGRELQLAMTGSHAEIRDYLDALLAEQGRDVELRAADVINSEQNHRRIALLAHEGRILCAADPSAPPRLDEMTAMLAYVAADISQSGDLSDGEPLLLQRGRHLIMYDPRQSPADIEIGSPAVCRAFFTRSLNSMYGSGDWPYFRRTPDLVYHSFIPQDLPRIDRGFSWSPDGTIFFMGKKATQAQVKTFWEPRDTGSVKTRVPDVEPLSSLDDITEQAFSAWLRARDFSGVDDLAELTGQAIEGVPQSLAQRMADLAARTAPVLWRGGKSDLARDVQWSGSVMLLNAELRKITGELASLGWCLARGGRTKGTQAREFVIMPLRPGTPPENPAGEIPGTPN